jgi:hypothetical protein
VLEGSRPSCRAPWAIAVTRVVVPAFVGGAAAAGRLDQQFHGDPTFDSTKIIDAPPRSRPVRSCERVLRGQPRRALGHGRRQATARMRACGPGKPSGINANSKTALATPSCPLFRGHDSLLGTRYGWKISGRSARSAVREIPTIMPRRRRLIPSIRRSLSTRRDLARRRRGDRRNGGMAALGTTTKGDTGSSLKAGRAAAAAATHPT